MELSTTIAGLREHLAARRADGAAVGLVPTMGYLHRGHASLIDAAARDTDEVVVTVFVNPLQFAPGEDLDAYPRDLDGDSAMAAAHGATTMFVPDLVEMYPGEVATTVSVAGVSESMEGASRPTHFAGVATVVAKLFSIVGPCRAYFGEKDFQQLAVIRRLASDLSMPVDVVGCPIVRESDGLAMSSRNVYLTPAERDAAPVLHRALLHGASLVAAGAVDPAAVRRAMTEVIESEPLVSLDYVEVADPADLRPVRRCTPEVRLFGAVRFGRARLIDNVAVADVGAGDGVVAP